MIIKTGQVSSSKDEGGQAIVEVGGFKPGTLVHAALIGWSFVFDSPTPRPIQAIEILTQDSTLGGWDWAHAFRVQNNGYIKMRYLASIRDDNGDDPYRFTVVYLLFGE